MNRDEVRPCLLCRNGLAKANGLFFYVVTVQRMAFDHQAIREHHGLETIVGSPAIAAALAPNPVIAKPVGEPDKVYVCDDCAIYHRIAIAQIPEAAAAAAAPEVT